MSYLTTRDAPAIGQAFNGTLCDDGRYGLPVTAVQVSDFWIRVGADDFRQILSKNSCSGVCTFGLTPSRKNALEQARLHRLREAVAAGLALQVALGRLDAADQGRAKMLVHQLQHWLEIPESTPVQTPAQQGEADRRVAPSMASTSAGSKGLTTPLESAGALSGHNP
jgi:hypothetical protein